MERAAKPVAGVSGVHLRVRAGGEEYGFPVEWVLEVAELGELTPVPGAAPGILGVRNLKSQVVPIVDLAAFLGIGTGADAGRVVVAESPGGKIGFTVEDVISVDPLPEPSGDSESPYLAGSVLVDSSLVGILDPAKIFAELAAGQLP